jgi:sarcosine oxidase subunit beta
MEHGLSDPAAAVHGPAAPRGRTPRGAEVVVIGAGVIGAAIAFFLARHGARPLVLEGRDAAAGSSGACEGHIFMQSKKPGLHLELALESRRLYASLAAELGPGIDYEACGGMVAIETEAELAAMRKVTAAQRESGLEVSLLDGPEVREREPCLSESVLAAAYSPLDARVNPIHLTLALVRAAEGRGAVFAAGHPVEALEVAGGRIRAVRSAGRRIETPLVVNAAGAAAGELARLAGLAAPITPRRGQILVTAAVPRLLRHCLISAQYIAAKFDPGLAAKGGMGFSAEQTGEGNFLIGATREFVGFDRRTTFTGIRSIAGRIVPVIPALARVPVIRSFGGLRPYTPDGLPILGRAAGLEGFVMAAGHEGDGIALAPVTGELIADLIATGRTKFSLEPFRLERFAKEAA